MLDNQLLISDLKETKRMLAKHGRCTGDYGSPDGRVCLIGAMSAVLFDGNPWLAEFGNCDSELDRRFDAMVAAVTAHLPGHFFIPAAYNDDKDTTDTDIQTLLDKTIADLGGAL